MTDTERKLLNKQYKYALIFKDNTITPWVVNIANEIMVSINKALNDNYSGTQLMNLESYVQDLCDIFEEPNAKYKHQLNYDLCLAKYGNTMMPFNYLWRVHDITGMGLGIHD